MVNLSGVDDTAFRHVNNRYYDGAHYDRRYASYTHDIEFWCDVARSCGADVLELAAGTGRLSVPIAERGCQVVGIDIAPTMTARLAAKVTAAAAPRFVIGDMRNFDLDATFDLVFIACSSFCHLLSDADVQSCLAMVARHLRPAGTFGLDVATPDRESSFADDQWRPRFEYDDPEGPGQVIVTGRRRYNQRTRLLTDDLDYFFTSDGRTERAKRISRMYPFAELTRLLTEAGYIINESYGSFDREPLTATSQTQILLCSAAARSE